MQELVERALYDIRSIASEEIGYMEKDMLDDKTANIIRESSSNNIYVYTDPYGKVWLGLDKKSGDSEQDAEADADSDELDRFLAEIRIREDS